MKPSVSHHHPLLRLALRRRAAVQQIQMVLDDGHGKRTVEVQAEERRQSVQVLIDLDGDSQGTPNTLVRLVLPGRSSGLNFAHCCTASTWSG